MKISLYPLEFNDGSIIADDEGNLTPRARVAGNGSRPPNSVVAPSRSRAVGGSLREPPVTSRDVANS